MKIKAYVKGTIKIKRKLWPLIVNKIKTEEYRKLSTGIDEGNYLFTALDNNETLGTVYLVPVRLWTVDTGKIWQNDYSKEVRTDNITFDFVTKNYVGWYDFIQYHISNIEDWTMKP